MQSNENKDYSGLEELVLSEVMGKYNNFIVSSAIQNAGETNQVVDFGAGIGTLAMIFRERYQINPLCVEIDELNKEHLKREISVFLIASTQSLTILISSFHPMFSSI